MNAARFVFRPVLWKPVAPIRLVRAIDKAKVFASNEDGVTAIEYGLIAALIAIVIITSVGLVGTNLNTLFSDVAASV